ncbi:ATP synthase subunit I [Nitrosomonas sp. sh817]|uniref:ATP synthase subunit I n=1 Tax=Nitrosomonas sp. sh817 TaxID=3070658 RepID=UPI0027DDF318|nr:ATP synthase subunit I [Nitrosomonas sp. sh817]WMJ08763.1 ATP synthase subunit I [Nitrosomonas sp. sh817]
MSWIKNRPLKIVLRIQLLVTLIAASVFWIMTDLHGGISALLGGLISVITTAAYAVMVSQHSGFTAGAALRTALRAEAVKIILTIGFLWVVFKCYESVNAFVFIGTFILIVLIYSLALLIADDTKSKIR